MIDLCQAVAKDLAQQLKSRHWFRSGDQANRLDAITQNKADLFAIHSADGRAAHVDFSVPTFIDGTTAIRNDGPRTSPAAGKKVGVAPAR
jgi:ABC-type amino acid transport substrate-binding protein